MVNNNDNNGRIGCEAGRTKIVDPNDFNGFNSSSNMSVPTEDLNISVILRTSRKGRTVLSTDKDKNMTSTSSKDVTVNFIQGSDVNGQKVLTTKYTDLTTIVEHGAVNTETLGITNIDIDFNTSYTPQVTINFVDLRGSSIFQNEDNIGNFDNPYSTFFQIPYPTFELEIKGFYGKPVTYCLHMLKMNSKFNSKTGNFEIQCEFVGYTYAMLSDLLIGFLRANALTNIGKEKYKLYNENKDNVNGTGILTLQELTLKLQSLNKPIEKEAATSSNSVGFENTKKALDKINEIYSTINALGSVFQSTLKLKENSIQDKYPYIVIDFGADSDFRNKEIISFKNTIKKIGDEWNALNIGTKFNITDFQDIEKIGENRGYYPNVSKDSINPNNNRYDDYYISELKATDVKTFKEKIFTYLTQNFDLADNLNVGIYNMSYLYDAILTLQNKVNAENVAFKKSLAVELKDTVKQALGFNPTVRNLIEIYTAASEVFLESIYDVSVKAEAETNTKRQTQLASKFNVDKNTDSKNVKDKPEINLKAKYFPWPDYKEVDSKGVFVEKYLGSAGVLTNPLDVEEIAFVEELYKKFIEAAKSEASALEEFNRTENHWTPINPLDTKLLDLNEPYSRVEILNHKDVIRLAVIRGMTFLGYTNKENSLSDKEIIGMAEAEADNILRSIPDSVKQVLITKIKDVNTDSSGSKGSNETKVTLTEYINITGKINDKLTKVVYLNTEGKYLYNYIFDLQNQNSKHQSVIPINKNFQGEWFGDDTSLVKESLDNNIFLTNYSSNYGEDANTKHKKIENGGVYVKIISVDTYNQTVNNFPLNTLPNNYDTKSVFSLKALMETNVKQTAGFNVLGGPLGVQDFSLFIDDVSNVGKGKEIPMKIIFYSNSLSEQHTGLAFDRFNSINKQEVVTPYDRNNPNGFILPDNREDLYSQGIVLHKFLGQNRTLLVNFKDNNYIGITYPYLDVSTYSSKHEEVYGPDLRSAYDKNSFSLFGSKLYYAQKDQYAKAYLFLNILPFNKGRNTASPFENNEIRHLFDTRGGLVHAPLLWCAWVGSILWRLDTVNAPVIENGIQIDGGSGDVDPIRWWFDGHNDDDIGKVVDGQRVYLTHPNRKQYFTSLNPLGINSKNVKYLDITKGDILANLPVQVVKEFKRVFFDFVKNEGGSSLWDNIRNGLEIWNGTSDEFNKYVDKFSRIQSGLKGVPLKISQEDVNLKNVKTYSIITSVPKEDGVFKDYLFLELAGSFTKNPSVATLINSMNEELIIMNNGYEIWQSPNLDGDLKLGSINKLISAEKATFNLYFNTLNKRLVDSKAGLGDSDKNIQISSEIFGTNNQDIIKLRIYKHCKNLYDKWIGGVTDPNKIIFQCGVNAKSNTNRSNTDSKLALQYGNKTAKLIDSFRFVSRSFEDIGDSLYINPLPINDYLTSNQNASIYESITSLLSSNNFDFIALPTFINFRDDEEVKAIFRPYPNYTEAIKEGTCGPTFVCTYVGEPSKHLAIANSEYNNDGFDLRCAGPDKTLLNIPADFASTVKDYEDPVAVFTVKYSQQNQNIFKDVILDQSEFTETEESLKILDDISQKGAETNRTLAGQNLYSVHSVRSYKAEVEMMGNAMIQPMMYFQLENIPMFHGAYMVIRTKHSIKPNYMSTHFTGVRIKYSKTAEIDAADVYMSLIDTLDTASAVSTETGSSGSVGRASRTAKATVKCNVISKTKLTLEEAVKLVFKYLEGAYCRGGLSCGSKNSGETLWGLDRKNHEGKLDDQFWSLVDTYDKSKWNNTTTPNINSDSAEIKKLFALYVQIIQKDYNSFSKKFYKSQAVRDLVEADGRLFFNMVYAVYNGGGYFKGLCKLMQRAYDSGTKTSDGLLKVVVDERVHGLTEAYRLGSRSERAHLSGGASTLLANTGVDIEKLVGLSNSC